MTLSMCRNR